MAPGGARTEGWGHWAVRGGPRAQVLRSPGKAPLPAGRQVCQSYGLSGEAESEDWLLTQRPVAAVRAALVGSGLEGLEAARWAETGQVSGDGLLQGE